MLITQEDFEKAASGAGVDTDMSAYGMASLGRAFSIPEEASRRIVLARELLHELGPGELLLRIREFGVWPSSECDRIVELVRSTEGVTVPTIRATHESIGAGKEEYRMALVSSMLLNLWDFVLLSPERRAAVHFSHDEYFAAIAGDDVFVAAIVNIAVRLELTQFWGFKT